MAEDVASGERCSSDAGEADRHYRTLVDAVDDGLYQLDRRGHFVALNDTVTEVTGYAREALLGQHVSTVLDEADVARGDATIGGLLGSEPDTATLDVSVKRADGTLLPCELRVSLLVEDGEFRGTVGVIEDVSEEGKGNLASIPDRYESVVDGVLDAADVGAVVFDSASEVAWVNEATERYFGLDREAVLGCDGQAVVDEWLREAVADPDAFAEAVLTTDDAVDGFECRVVPGDGREGRWLQYRSEPIESGQYAGGRIELYDDVTEQKRTDQALAESERRFRSLVDAVEEYAIFMLDPDGCVVTWNEGARHLKGYDETGIVGQHVSTFYTEDDREAGAPGRNLAAAAEQGSVEDEGWRVRKDGSQFWANVTITAIRDDDGSLLGYAKVTKDMTERKRARAERELLHETTRDVAEAETVEDGLQAALRDVCEVTDWECAEAWFPTDEGELRRAGADYYQGDLAKFAASSDEVTFAPDEGLPGRVWASGEYEWAADLSAGSREVYPRLDEALDAGLKSALGVPVVAGDEVVAVLTFLMREVRKTDEWLVDLVSSVAVELGELLARRRIESTLERERELTEQILETAPVGIGVFAPDGEMERANERTADILGPSTGGVEGYTAGDRTLLDENGAPVSFEDSPMGRVFETGEPVFKQEIQLQTPEGSTRWVSVNATPIRGEHGDVARVVATATDVSQLKAQAGRLERQRDGLEAELDEVYRRIDDAFFALDDEWRFTHVNDRAEEYLERDESDLLGASIWEAFPGAVDSTFEESYRRAMETQRPVSFEESFEPLAAWFEVRAYPSASGLSVYFNDVTERKEREQELTRYERIIDTVGDPVYELDAQGRFAYVNQALVEQSGYDADELLGEHVSIGMDAEAIARAESAIADLLADDHQDNATLEYEAKTKGGERTPVENNISPLTDDQGRIQGTVGVLRDVTERKERERELEQYETLSRTASDVIVRMDADSVIREVNPAVAEVFGYEPGELIGESMTTLMPDRLTDAHLAAMQQYLRDRERRLDWEYVELPGVRADGTEISLAVSFSEYEHGGQRYFTGILRDISERKERERELERQRERLAALNYLNDVVRDITDAVIEQSTREEIERTVCEALASPDAYEFAWIGEVDPASEAVEPRAEAGTRGYVDDVELSVDPDDPRGQGPGGVAIRTGETQVLTDAFEDPEFEPWREKAEEYGYRSGIAVPIVHGGTTYGVLCVYGARPGAFVEEERAVFDQLGEVVGHAIAAAERKQALMSDDVIELDFHIEDVFAELDLPVAANDRITIDRTVPAGDDEYLVYGTASADGMAAVEALVGALPHWTAVRVVREGDRTEFEARLNEPPVLSMLASRGGYVREAHIEDGDYGMQVQLPHSVAIREVVEAVQQAYPGAEVRAQRQVTRAGDGPRRVASTFEEELTDRQRAVVESAYFAGYFDWPRESSGEDVAESLSISPATFSQHLRKAENRIFAALFEGR